MVRELWAWRRDWRTSGELYGGAELLSALLQRAHMLRIKLLGPMEVEAAGQVLPSARLHKVMSLLAWLAVQGDRPVSYAEIGEALWPGSESGEGGRDSVRRCV